jgi:hypothetical protein
VCQYFPANPLLSSSGLTGGTRSGLPAANKILFIQRLESLLDSRFRGNDNGRKGHFVLPEKFVTPALEEIWILE